MKVSGNQIVARTLRELGAEHFFYLMGGPMLHLMQRAMAEGIRGIDMRHEQAAAMAAHAYARIRRQPGVCMACSGPGTTNLLTGVACAYADAAPLVVLGGASSIRNLGRGAFQEFDQLALMRPVTKWAVRAHDAARLGEIITEAWVRARSGRPGPVYVDLPDDVLYAKVDEESVAPAYGPELVELPAAAQGQVERAVQQLAGATRPVVIAGSGVMWDSATDGLNRFAVTLGLPVFTTPMARGVVDETGSNCFPATRSHAFREADCIILVGSRPNYVVNYLSPPRFSPHARIIRLDIDADSLAMPRHKNVTTLLGGIGATLDALLNSWSGHSTPEAWREWLSELAQRQSEYTEKFTAALRKRGETDTPIHPVTLTQRISERLGPDDITVVDGHETLIFARQTIPVHRPYTHLNPGVSGCMGVGIPYGIGAKVAAPDRRVVVITGDGSFGMNGFELDTAARHGIDLKVVINNNGGWTADPTGDKPGRNLGFTAYEDVGAGLGVPTCNSVRNLAELDSMLDKTIHSDGLALLNVLSDENARASISSFLDYPFVEMGETPAPGTAARTRSS